MFTQSQLHKYKYASPHNIDMLLFIVQSYSPTVQGIENVHSFKKNVLIMKKLEKISSLFHDITVYIYV